MLEINKIDARISINTTKARQSIQQPKPDFEMHQTHAKIELKTEQVKVKISQKQCFNESGLMDPMTLTENAAQNGREAVMNGISRRIDEGHRLSAIENRSNAISDIALSNSFDIKTYDLGTMPKSRPQIDFVGGNVDIRVGQEGNVTLKSKPNQPIIDAEMGTVEVSMTQFPELHIKYLGEKLDQKI